MEDDQSLYHVEAIVDYKRGRGRERGYLVKWVDWPAETNTWEPLAHVEHCTEELADFYKSRLEARSRATPLQKRLLQLPPRPANYEEVESESEVYEVEKILEYQEEPPSYLVKWTGYDDSHNSWECPTNLVSCQELLDEFARERAAPTSTSAATRVSGEILKKVTANPKTIKERIQNEEAYR